MIESRSDIVCLQETKKEIIDQVFLKNICPHGFDSFVLKPSTRALGGILIAWKGTLFAETEIFQNDFAISVEMRSALNNSSWILTTIYAPCTPSGKRAF